MTLFAQYAADIFPLEMLDAWRAWNDLRRAAYDADSPGFLGEPETPCCPKRIVFTWSPCLATTMCDFLGWLGVALGLLYPDTPALARRESFLDVAIDFLYCENHPNGDVVDISYSLGLVVFCFKDGPYDC